MPSASVLAATNLVVPPVPRYVSAHASSYTNEDHFEIFPHTTTPVPQPEMLRFRSYLNTIPFDFHDHQPAIVGRMLESEGDVRLFLESAAVLPCWPIALSMIPAGRNFDLNLRSGKNYADRNTSDLSVLSAITVAGGGTVPLLVVEFKGPGALSFCRNGIPTGDCDA
jgi:hypothetical protein